MSEKDKNLLLILVVIIVLAIPYFALYRPYIEKVNETKFNIEKIEQEIESIRLRKEQLKDSDKEKTILEFNINETLESLPPDVFIERILLDIEDIQKEADVRFDTESFSDVNQVTDYLQNVTISEGKSPVEMTVELDFRGTYNGLKNFLYLISEAHQNMRIDDISLNPGVNTDMTGSIMLTYFAYKDVSLLDKIPEYEVKSDVGKDNIFIPYDDFDEDIVFEEDDTELIIELEKYDFNIRLSPSTGVRPSVLVEKTELPLSRALDDGNKNIDVEIDILEENGEYFYRYKTEFTSYPVSYEYVKFTPYDEERILIKLISDNRFDEDDLAGANIKVYNRTEIRCVINNFIGDYERADIVIEEGEVYVYKKELEQ